MRTPSRRRSRELVCWSRAGRLGRSPPMPQRVGADRCPNRAATTVRLRPETCSGISMLVRARRSVAGSGGAREDLPVQPGDEVVGHLVAIGLVEDLVAGVGIDMLLDGQAT